jgi:hypothetical protein
MKLYVEKFKDGNWHKVGRVFRDPFIGQYVDQPFSWPKLELYSIFADVENRFGIEPISQPRGFPEDVSEEVNLLYLSKNINVFPSYLVLDEVVDYNFYRTFNTTAYISLFDYPNYLTKGVPDFWYTNVKVVDSNFTKLIDCDIASILYNLNIIEPLKKIVNRYGEVPAAVFPTFYVKVTWSDSLINRLGEDFFDMLDQLKLISDRKDFSDVRLVFWFTVSTVLD